MEYLKILIFGNNKLYPQPLPVPEKSTVSKDFAFVWSVFAQTGQDIKESADELSKANAPK